MKHPAIHPFIFEAVFFFSLVKKENIERRNNSYKLNTVSDTVSYT